MKRKNIFLFCFLFLFFLTVSLAARATVVLRVLVANPSKDYSQSVPVKVYLPKEVQPQDVIDKGDLEIGYDTQQGSYYVYGDYELDPAQVLDKEIELRDIWLIPMVDLESLRMEADELKDFLHDTPFAQRTDFLYKGIIAKLDEIIRTQNNPNANPQDHISQYRVNLETLAAVRADLSVMRSMLDKDKGFPAANIWKLILYVLGFLALISVSFYFVWQRQARVMNDIETSVAGTSGADKESKAGPSKDDDIDNILGGE